MSIVVAKLRLQALIEILKEKHDGLCRTLHEQSMRAENEEALVTFHHLNNIAAWHMQCLSIMSDLDVIEAEMGGSNANRG